MEKLVSSLKNLLKEKDVVFEEIDYVFKEKNEEKNKEKKKILDLINIIWTTEKIWKVELTMRELYEVNGKEFTCTSVDTDSQILRFFNHKTTPDLPACRAIQMTGSFPVAF